MRIDHKILLFSDIHAVETGERIIGLDPIARFQQGLDHALQRHGDAERIVILGDLTHHGSEAEYRRLRAVLENVEIPISLTLGNHDARDAFLETFGAPVTEDGFVQEVLEFGNLRLITLDTFEDSAEPKHSGRLCKTRLAWLRTELERAEGARVIIAMHHPPFGVGFPGMDRIALSNAQEFLDLIGGFPNVVQILAGHIHRTIAGNIGGIPLFVLKSPCHQMPMALGALGSAHSVDEPGAYGIMLIGPGSVILHSEDFAIAQAAIRHEDYGSH